MKFQIIGEIKQIEIIAVGTKIRDIERLRKMYGRGRWRKLKGVAQIRLKSDKNGWRNFIGMRRTASESAK